MFKLDLVSQKTARQTFPKEVEVDETYQVGSFAAAVDFLEDDTCSDEGLGFGNFSPITKGEETMLKRLPLAFASNSRVKKLEFCNLAITQSDMAEALRVGMSQENIVCLNFQSMSTEETLTKILCQAFQERSSPIQLELYSCSPGFCKTVLDSSYLDCFSLALMYVQSHELEKPLKKCFSRGSLCYLTLEGVSGLKDSIFLHLSRCIPLLPGLIFLGLTETKATNYALITLCDSLAMRLGSGRSNLFDWLTLQTQNAEERLIYCWFKLIESDLIKNLLFFCSNTFSTTIVKHVSSTVANTTNTRIISFSNFFSSGTEFTSFKLQRKATTFFGPFGVNKK